MEATVTSLLAAIGILVTIILTIGTPRLLGQIVPVAQVDAAKQAGLLEAAKARAEADTWKAAFEGMKEAHNGLLNINQQLSQSAVIANAIMNQFKQQPQTPAAPTGSG